jgi:Dolichyl-phosphate-mannose-protein mannosyltransferase
MPTRTEPDIPARSFRLGLLACALGVAAFLAVKLTAWPPHEDETLALFVGRGSFDELLETVLGQRGGAPLHFALAWLVAHAGGGLTELRAVSALLAVASIPVVGLLVARLADRRTALTATALASASWILLFHGVYARMYSLFLLTSALSYLAFLAALDRGGRRAWALWVAAVLATVATHPYAALVLGSQGVFVLVRRERLREAVAAFGAVAVLGIPFWYTDLVLAGRFDVGIGGGGSKLASPLDVFGYLSGVAGDFTVGWVAGRTLLLAAAGFGLWRLARTRPRSAVLVGSVFGLPTLALLLGRFGESTSPESRHLIFALPFFSMLVASALVGAWRRGRREARAATVLALLALMSAQLAWAREKTPPLFTGDSKARIAARRQASAWLAATSRPDDVLFGYEPVYLRAWERSSRVSRTVVPRADAKLALRALREAPEPLGRGVWVFDAADNNNFRPKLTIPLRLPSPHREFEGRVFGPYLIVRTRERSRTPKRYLEQASQVMILGKDLFIGDADVNFVTVRRAAYRLERSSDRSSSSSR